MNLIDTKDNDWKLRSILSSKKSDRIHNRKRRVAKTKWLSSISKLMNFPDEEELATEEDNIAPKELPFLDEVNHPAVQMSKANPDDDDEEEDELLHTNLGFNDLDSDSNDDNDDEEEDEDSSSGEEEVFGSFAHGDSSHQEGNSDVSEELRQKLRERLEELKLKRQRKPDNELNGKRSVERRKKKDQQKQKKVQKKEKSKEFQKRLKESKQTGIFMDDDDSQKKRKVEEDNFAYSTLVVNNGKATPSYLSPVSKKISTKKKIEELETLKNELNLKKKENPQEAKKIEAEVLWKNAFDRTTGEKVKDDLTKLKKSVKAKEKKKQKSKEAWEKRDKQLEEKQKERQEKRKMNIREHSMKKKIKQLQKKGRSIPEKLRSGFEGKRKTVLNRKKN